MGEQLLTDEQVLQNFLLDIRCLDKLLPWIGKFNIFDVLKISKNEIRHSNVLCWLLDPSENHGFGDAFIKGVFQRIVENDIEDKHDIFKTLLSDMYSFSVQREWKNIDILLVSNEEKIVLAIITGSPSWVDVKMKKSQLQGEFNGWICLLKLSSI